MKFDTVIIGGGLSGLTCGILLAKQRRKTVIVSAGQSSLHFFSGSFDLLGYSSDGQMVEHPLEAIQALDENHPYKKIGTERLENYAQAFMQILNGAGIKVKGDIASNHCRFTPVGLLKPAWLTLQELATTDFKGQTDWKKVGLVSPCDFLDFPMDFFVDTLQKSGVVCEVKILHMEELEQRRKSPSENRAVNLAKTLDNEAALDFLSKKLKEMAEDVDAVLMPAILGLNNTAAIDRLCSELGKPLYLLTTLPPSVSGMRLQYLFRKEFVRYGGVFLAGDEVVGGTFEDNMLQSIQTKNLPDEDIMAEHFVLATGSFKGRGLSSNYNEVTESLFHLDVDAVANRSEWAKENVYEDQPYMRFGVKTNAELQTYKDGQVVGNLFATGSILSGHNAIKQADGTGVDIMTSIRVADAILNK